MPDKQSYKRFVSQFSVPATAAPPVPPGHYAPARPCGTGGLRPGSIADANDEAQFAELETLGELTQIVPFQMVDAVLAECGATQRRVRKLPARVVVYLLLAAALFEECGYPAVWARLTAALGPLHLPGITATGLWHARARLGVRPLHALFDLLAGPAAAIRTAGARWCVRRSVDAGGASTSSKAKAHSPARGGAHEKTEQPKGKKTRRTA